MSKTIYYLGAGASYGKRSETGEIIEGLPIVSIPNCNQFYLPKEL